MKVLGVHSLVLGEGHRQVLVVYVVDRMTVSEGRTKVSGVVGDHKSLMVGRTIQMAFAEVHTSWMVVENHKTA